MEIEEKIEQLRDEINRYCDEHSISEKRIMEVAKLINERNDLIYQSQNEVWEKRKPEDVYFDIDSLREFVLPDLVSVAIHFRQNSMNYLFKEIEDVFGINIGDIYDYSYVNDVDKEYEEMCQKYNPQDAKFVIWCLKREFPDKEIEYHQYNGLCQGDVYDCFFMYDKKDYENINNIVAIVKNYCQSDYEQYVRDPDNVLDYTDVITIFESELPSKNLRDEDEIRRHLFNITGTGRNIIIE